MEVQEVFKPITCQNKTEVGTMNSKKECIGPGRLKSEHSEEGFTEAPRFEVDVKCESLSTEQVSLPPADRPSSPDCILPDSTVEDGDAGRESSEESAEDLEHGEEDGQPSISSFVVNVSDEAIIQCRLPDGTYSCPMCQKHIIKKDSIKRHMKKHERPIFSCKFCGKVFYQEHYYNKHVATHTGDRVYDCDECEKKFKSSSNLSQHKRVVHVKAKLFTCQICTRSFSIQAHLIRHAGGKRCKKPVERPLKCDVCQKTFEKVFLLKSHLRKHSTEKPFQCDYCKMNFKYKATLERHILMHAGVKNFPCKLCDKSYTHKALLRIHLRTHTGEKPYQCSICKKFFGHKHNMERHKVRHDKPKVTTCTICNKTFPRESRLIYHMRSHTKEQPFPCKVCPKKFTHKQNALRHYQRKHPNHVYECAETDASVARNLWKDIQDNQIRVVKKRIHERNFKQERLLKAKASAPEVVHIKAEEFEAAINNAESMEVISDGDKSHFGEMKVKDEPIDSDECASGDENTSDGDAKVEYDK